MTKSNRKTQKKKTYKKKTLKLKRKKIINKRRQTGGGNGITINDTTVTSLSGPISFYYLKPKVDASEMKYFPLIVLFGDLHRSKEFSCEHCTCSTQEDGNCCYTISDHSFLKLLDTLGDAKNPVDFFTETFFLRTFTSFENASYMEDLTTKDMVTCYQKSLRGTEHYNKCPTKNIRWQAGDPRQAGDMFSKLDGYDDYYYLKYGDKEGSVNNLLKQQINGTEYIKTISKKYRDDSYFEFQFSELIYLLNYIFEDLFENKDRDTLDNHIENFNALLIKSKLTFDDFLLILSDLYDFKTDSLNFDKFSKTFFSKLNRDNSLIFKQIIKQDYAKFKDISYWSDIYEKSLQKKMQQEVDKGFSLKDFKDFLLNVKDIFKFVDDFFNTTDRDFRTIVIECYQVLLVLQLALSSSLLDIYSITRILKKPEGGNRSSLTFGYFGNNHVKNIVKILLETQKYILVQEITTNVDKRRCLVFPFALDLTDEVRNYNLISI